MEQQLAARPPDLDDAGKPVATAPPDLDEKGQPIFHGTNEKDAQGNAVVDPNTLGTFLRHFATQINPVALGQLLPFPKKLGGAGWDAPIKAGQDFMAGMAAVKAKGDASWAKGNHVDAIRHYADWLGSVLTMGQSMSLDKASDESEAGHVAAGLGDATGIGLSAFAPDAMQLARESAPAATMADRAAGAADERFADVMSPKGSSKAVQRTAKQAVAVAEDVRQGTTAITREGLQAQVAERLSDAGDKLDEAYGSIHQAQPYSTAAIVKRLEARRAALDVSGDAGAVTSTAVAPRAAALDQAISEVKKLGTVTTIDNLTRLKNQWKVPAQDAFTPSLNPNFQQIRGASEGWADAWSSLQDHLTDAHPELKPLNADYHVWKQASQVLQAAEDQQRAKPTVGRTIMARAGGAAAGAAAGGGLGMVAGEVMGPLVERGLSQKVAPAMKLAIARELGNLADAIRAGKPTLAEQLLRRVRPLLLTSIAAPQGVGELIPAAVQAGAGRPGADQKQ